MDTYELALAFVSNLPCAGAWAELLEPLRRVAAHKPRSWTLPVLACQAVGGAEEQAVPAVAAIGCLQTSILLVDDLLDNDPRGEFHRIGVPATANFAVALQATGLEAIARSGAGHLVRLAALERLNEMALAVARGQHLDAQDVPDEDAYWRVVQAKSSPFFGAALEVGALLGGAALDVVERLGQLGRLCGEVIQIHDDLSDTLAVPAGPDWMEGRSALPILFAQLVPHAERERFLQLRRAICDQPEALQEAQAILIRCGAVSYCIDLLLRRLRRAQQVLAGIPLAHGAGLALLLEQLVAPIRDLFRAIGLDEMVPWDEAGAR